MNIQTYYFNDDEIQILLDDNNNPWWVASDVCQLLGLGNTTEALRAIPDKNKLVSKILRPGQRRAVNLINESGLYRLIVRSGKPVALQFQDWIFEKILPEIRRTGSYSVKELSKDERLKQLAESTLELLQIKQQLESKVQEMLPKAQFHDSIISSSDCISVGEMGRLLNTGQKRLFKWLRENKILRKNNQPYQEFLNRCYFDVNEMTLANWKLYIQTLITTKGQVWLSQQYK